MHEKSNRKQENNLSQEGPHMGFLKCLSSSHLIIPILGHLGCVCALNKEHMSNRTRQSARFEGMTESDCLENVSV